MRIMLVFGGALTVCYYPDYALFPAVDFSILIQASEVRHAIERLQTSGWRAEPTIPISQIDSYLTTHFAYRLRDGSGRRMMLHWHAVPQFYGSETDKHLWNDTEEVDMYGMPVCVPSPTNQLLLLCAQSSAIQGASLFMRAMDVMMLLRGAGDRIDWDLLLARAREHRLTVPVRDTLKYLQQRLEVSIPAAFLERLRESPASSVERLEYWLLRQQKTPFSRAALLWLFYGRRRRGDVVGKVAGFPEFLRSRWRLRTTWQLPGFAASASWQLMRSSARKSKV